MLIIDDHDCAIALKWLFKATVARRAGGLVELACLLAIVDREDYLCKRVAHRIVVVIVDFAGAERATVAEASERDIASVAVSILKKLTMVGD